MSGRRDTAADTRVNIIFVTQNNSYFDITAVDVNKIQRMGNLINSMNNTRYNCSFYIIVMIEFRVEVNISR